MSSIRVYLINKGNKLAYSDDLCATITLCGTSILTPYLSPSDIGAKKTDKNFICAVGSYSTGVNQGIIYSLDGGNTFTQSGGTWLSSTPSATFTKICVCPNDESIIYVSSSQSIVAKSTDGGLTFSSVGTTSSISGLPPGANTRSVYSTNGVDVVVSISTNVYYSNDGGTSWAIVGAAVDGVENPFATYVDDGGNLFFAVTKNGVFSSTGGAWSSAFAFASPLISNSRAVLSIIGTNTFYTADATSIYLTTDSFVTTTPVYTIQDLTDGVYDMEFYNTASGLVIDNIPTTTNFGVRTTDSFTTYIPITDTANNLNDCVKLAIGTGPACGCSNGYVYNPGSGDCEQTATIDAVYSGTLLTVNAGETSAAYSKYGARLYEDITNKIFPIIRPANNITNLVDNNGAGSIISIYNGIAAYGSIRNTLWGYDSSGAIPACGTGGVGGRLNTVGIGVLPTPVKPDYLCFEYCININTTKQYLIAFAADNFGKLYLDNTEIIKLELLNLLNAPPSENFFYWHIFPITLTSGTHTLKICGSNNDLVTDFAFGAEIYNISAADFVFNNFLSRPALNSADCGNIPTDLTNGVNSNGEPILMFSTGDYIGQQVADPSGTGLWTCPPGWELNICFGIPSCKTTLTAEYNPCCYDLINCADGTIYATVNTNALEFDILAEYVGSTIVFEGLPECLFVTVTGECDNATSIENLNITDTFTTCQECQEAIEINPCYKLTNCNNGDVFIMTQQNLSQVTGLVVELAEYPGLCWTVLETYNCVGEFTTVSIVQSYPDCECCFQYQCV